VIGHRTALSQLSFERLIQNARHQRIQFLLRFGLGGGAVGIPAPASHPGTPPAGAALPAEERAKGFLG